MRTIQRLTELHFHKWYSQQSSLYRSQDYTVRTKLSALVINTFKEPCRNLKYWLFCVILIWQNKLRKGALERGIDSFSLIWLILIPQDNVVLFTWNVFCVVLGIEHSALCMPDSALILAYFYGIIWVRDSSFFRYIWGKDHPFIPSLRCVPKGHWSQCDKMVSNSVFHFLCAPSLWCNSIPSPFILS